MKKYCIVLVFLCLIPGCGINILSDQLSGLSFAIEKTIELPLLSKQYYNEKLKWPKRASDLQRDSGVNYGSFRGTENIQTKYRSLTFDADSNNVLQIKFDVTPFKNDSVEIRKLSGVYFIHRRGFQQHDSVICKLSDVDIFDKRPNSQVNNKRGGEPDLLKWKLPVKIIK